MQEPALSPSGRSPAVVLEVPGDVTAPLLVRLDEQAAFEAIRDDLRRELKLASEQVRGRSARLDIGQRRIDLFDIRRLVHLLKDDAEVVVTGVITSEDAVQRYAEQELKLRLHFREEQPATEDDGPAPETDLDDGPTEPSLVVADLTELGDDPGDGFLYGTDEVPAPTLPQDGSDSGRKLLVVDKTLRSGRNIRYVGDVLVFGDVNSGAEVEASGNILVMGSLRGLAHAGVEAGPGSDPDERAVVVAFDLRPTQIRIGRKIAFPPQRDDSRSARGLGQPEIAWVNDGAIVIEDYTGRLPNG